MGILNYAGWELMGDTEIAVGKDQLEIRTWPEIYSSFHKTAMVNNMR
jgi:hypothetical protein